MHRWLDAKAVGKMLSYDVRVVRERIACRPDFPRPMRIDGAGYPRWREDEVAAWAEVQRGLLNPGAPQSRSLSPGSRP